MAEIELRDHFACIALQAICEQVDALGLGWGFVERAGKTQAIEKLSVDDVAAMAYRVADAMLKARQSDG